jgi:predicted PurR-regulated permease PerM
MASMPEPSPGSGTPVHPPRIEIPRWIQLVGLPLIALLAWMLVSAVRHAVFIFLVAGLVALLLNPIVRAFERFRVPRGFSVAIVYLTFAALIVMAIVALATVVVDQTSSASDRIDAYFTEERGQPPETEAERDIDQLQAWLDSHRLSRIQIREQGRDWVDGVGAGDVETYSRKALDWIQGAAFGIFTLLFSLVLVIVISIYMLLDMNRLDRLLERRFPAHAGSARLLPRIESAVGGYVKGQALVSLIIGTSAGVGLWLLGTFGWLEGGDSYAVLFGGWVALAELIPYLGPWLGAIPPFIYALAIDPVSAIWVTILFLFIHQIEGHVVIPNVMGSALRLHPLLVIFGLLAGAEIYGLPGVFVALPTLAAVRAIWEYFRERVSLAHWDEAGPIPVEVELEGVRAAPVAPAEPRDPPAAASR